MNRSRMALTLKAFAVAAAVAGVTLAAPSTSAYAGSGPGGHCVVTWKQGSLANGYYGECQDNLGLDGSTLPWNFRVAITCVRASHPTTTVYGGYSDWRSSASCPGGYDVNTHSFQWINTD